MFYLILLFIFVNFQSDFDLTHFSWELLNENFFTNEEPAFLSAKIVSTFSKVIVSDHAFLTDSLWRVSDGLSGRRMSAVRSKCELIDGTSSDYPSGGGNVWCVCLLVFSAASLKLCTVCSVHYRLQQEVEDSSSAAHRPGLCVVPRPVISFARWTSLDVAKQHLTFRSSLNQADDQEQVQTAHIMQTFYKVVSTQAWLYVFLCICRAALCGMGERRAIQWTKQYYNSYVIYKRADYAEVMGLSKWGLQKSVKKSYI